MPFTPFHHSRRIRPRIRRRPFLLLCLILALLGSASVPWVTRARVMPQAKQPDRPAEAQSSAPVEKDEATDLPLNLKGATGETAEWLKSFDVKPQTFTYTMQLAEDEDDIRVYRLTYRSPFNSPFPENNLVPAEYYVPSSLPKESNGRVPGVVVLDIMHGNAVVARGMARGLAGQGVAAVYVPMAYYNARRPKNNAHLRYFDEDPTRTIEAIRQTVMDVRRAKAILASRPEVDPHHLGITGVSLGGIVCALSAGVDGEFDRVVPILAGGDTADITFHAPETRRVRERLLAKGIDVDKLRRIMAPVEPCNFASRIDPHRCLMINAEKDEVIPRETTEALYRAIGKPTLLWAPSGHYSAAMYLPTIKQTAIDFLKGKEVDRLEF